MTGLQHTIKKHQIVRFDRKPTDKDFLDGYVVGVLRDFILLHVIDHNMYLNGYSVIRVQDVKRYRLVDDWDHFMNKALKLRGESPLPLPQICLNNWRTIFETAQKLFPLLTIHREQMSNDVCYIGKIATISDKAVVLDEIDPAAKWERTRRYNFKDITKLDFGGGYEKALWQVSQAQSKAKKRK